MEAVWNSTHVAERSMAEEAERMYPWVYETIWAFKLSCLVLIFPAALLGNSLAFIIAARLNEGTSGTTFIQCLAVADTLAIIQDGLIEAGLTTVGIYIRRTHDIVCKFLGFYSWTTTIAANHVLMMFSFDRLIAVYAPFFYRQHGKRRVAIIVTLLVYGGNCAFHWFLPFVYRVGRTCAALDFSVVSEFWFLRLAEVAVIFLLFALPFFSIAAANVAIALKLRRNAANKLKKAPAPAAAATAEKKVETAGEQMKKTQSRDVTRQLLTVSMSFLIFNSAVSGIQMLVLYWSPKTPTQVAVFDMVNLIKEVPSALNNTVNFVLYILAGRMFRQEFLRMIGLGK